MAKFFCPRCGRSWGGALSAQMCCSEWTPERQKEMDLEIARLLDARFACRGHMTERPATPRPESMHRLKRLAELQKEARAILVERRALGPEDDMLVISGWMAMFADVKCADAHTEAERAAFVKGWEAGRDAAAALRDTMDAEFDGAPGADICTWNEGVGDGFGYAVSKYHEKIKALAAPEAEA